MWRSLHHGLETRMISRTSILTTYWYQKMWNPHWNNFVIPKCYYYNYNTYYYYYYTDPTPVTINVEQDIIIIGCIVSIHFINNTIKDLLTNVKVPVRFWYLEGITRSWENCLCKFSSLFGGDGIVAYKLLHKTHNVIQIHNNVLWEWQYFVEYFHT